MLIKMSNGLNIREIIQTERSKKKKKRKRRAAWKIYQLTQAESHNCCKIVLDDRLARASSHAQYTQSTEPVVLRGNLELSRQDLKERTLHKRRDVALCAEDANLLRMVCVYVYVWWTVKISKS